MSLKAPFLLVIYAHSCTNLWYWLSLCVRACACVCCVYLGSSVQLNLDEWKILEAEALACDNIIEWFASYVATGLVKWIYVN